MFHFFTLSLIYWLLLNNIYLMLFNRGSELLGVVAFLSALPCVYIMVFIIYWAYVIKKLPQRLNQRLKNGCSGWHRSGPAYAPIGIQDQDSQTPLCPTNSSSFADRMANPTAYDSLIPSRRKALARHHQTKALLVNEETQTSGKLSSCRVTSEKSVVLPWQPPTSSVMNLSQEETVRD